MGPSACAFARALGGVLLAVGVIGACSSASNDPPPHPATIVDCHAPPLGSASAGLTCAGACVPFNPCSDAGASVCPAGLHDDGLGRCPNGASCCVALDAGSDADADADGDAPSEDAPTEDATAE